MTEKDLVEILGVNLLDLGFARSAAIARETRRSWRGGGRTTRGGGRRGGGSERGRGGRSGGERDGVARWGGISGGGLDLRRGEALES